MTSGLITAVSPETVSEILKSSGYRVTRTEQNGAVQLLSAAQGIGFVVRFGNPLADPPAQYVDFFFSCVLQAQEPLPGDLIESWNRTKRFARLVRHERFLVLEMDVVVAGGVSEAYLRTNAELWDRMLQEFLLHLHTMTRSRDAVIVPRAG